MTCGPHIGVPAHSCCSRAPNGNCCHGAPRSKRASSRTVSAAKRSSGVSVEKSHSVKRPDRALVDALQDLLGGVPGAEDAQRDLLAGVEGVLLRRHAARRVDGAPVVAGRGEVRERAGPRLRQMTGVFVGLRDDQALRHGQEGQRLVAGRHRERRDHLARRLGAAAAADDADEGAGTADQQQAEERHEPAEPAAAALPALGALRDRGPRCSARHCRHCQFIARPPRVSARGNHSSRRAEAIGRRAALRAGSRRADEAHDQRVGQALVSSQASPRTRRRPG